MHARYLMAGLMFLLAGLSFGETPEEEEPAGITVIRGEDAPLSASRTAISKGEIEFAEPSSASEVLSLVPGMRIVQHGAEGKAHQFFLRGFDAVHGSDIEVVVHGIPLNERGNVHAHGYVDLYGVVPEAISRIYVEKGAYLPWQGDFATAGSVRLDLGLPKALRPGFVKAEGTHRGKLRASFVAGPRDAEEDTFVAGEFVRDPGFGPEREAWRGVANGMWGFNIGSGIRFSLFAFGQGAQWHSPGAVRLEDVESGRMGFYDTYGAGGRGESWRGIWGVKITHESPGITTETTVWGGVRALTLLDNYTGYLVNGSIGDLRDQSELAYLAQAAFSCEYDLALQFPATLLAGAGYRFDRVDQDEDGIDSNGLSFRHDRDLTANVHGPYAYIGTRLQPWHWFEVMPSIRGELLAYDVDDRINDRSSSKVMGAVLPRIAMAFMPHDMVTLFADYGRGFRSPEPRSVTAPEEGTIEDKETKRYRGGKPYVTIADDAEVGITIRPLDELAISIAGFGIWIDSESVFDHVSNTNLDKNATRRLGVELSIRATPFPWMRLDADATFCDARFVESQNPVPGSAPWSGRISADLGLERGVHGGVELLWTGTRNLAHQATATGYALLDLRLGYRGERYDMTLAMDNATASQAMDGVYHYASWFDLSKPRSLLPVIHFTPVRPITARLILTVFL